MIQQFPLKRLLNTKVMCWALFILSILMVIYVRWRLLNIPLERDEGGYAYFGQLILQGIPPYKLAYNMRLPGIYAMYALCMAMFGQSTQGIHLGFLVVNLSSIILLFLIARRLFGSVAGIISAVSYATLSISRSVLGVHAHDTHFIVAMALCGLLLLLKAADTEKKRFFFLSGLFFGLAFLMKQPGIFFIPFGLFYLSWIYFKKHPGLRRGLVPILMAYTLGAILPFAAACAILYRAGVFDTFWFWACRYVSEYSSGPQPYVVLKLLKDQLLLVAGPFRSIWYLAVAGLACLFIDAKARKHGILIVALSITSFLAICPGFVFRNQYFVVILPAVSILAGCCISSAYEFIRDRKQARYFSFVPVALFTSLLLYDTYQQRHYLFEASPVQISRETFIANPFIESVEIAKYIKEHSSPSDTIAVLGSEPQIYFYSRRRSATGHIYTYVLMEKPYALRMQREMIREIEIAKPRYVIFVNISASWLRRPWSEELLFKWADEYIRRHYTKVGVVDIHSRERTNYYWDAEAQNITPRSSCNVLVFRRED